MVSRPPAAPAVDCAKPRGRAKQPVSAVRSGDRPPECRSDAPGARDPPQARGRPRSTAGESGRYSQLRGPGLSLRTAPTPHTATPHHRLPEGLRTARRRPQLSGAGAEPRRRTLPTRPARSVLLRRVCAESAPGRAEREEGGAASPQTASRGRRRGSPLILPASSSAAHSGSGAARVRPRVCPGARPRRPVSGACGALGRAWPGGPAGPGKRSCGVWPQPRAGRRGRGLRLLGAQSSPGAALGAGGGLRGWTPATCPLSPAARRWMASVPGCARPRSQSLCLD